MVHPFELLAHPVRRRVVEVLAVGNHTAGTLSELAAGEFGASRTAVSHHLAGLRDHGAVWSSVDPTEPRSRAYRLNPGFLASLDDAVGILFDRWEQRYGTAEGRGPSFRIPADRIHRFDDAERRRRRDALAAWRGDEDDEDGDEVDDEDDRRTRVDVEP